MRISDWSSDVCSSDLMASSLIVRGAKAHIVDFGLGVTDLFMRTWVPFRAVESIFLTHHLPDHNIEYGPFLLLGWLPGLPPQLAAYGPPPLAQMTTDYVRAMAGTTADRKITRLNSRNTCAS